MESSPGSGSGSPTAHGINLKHFKKAFLVEYERIESHNSGELEDSNSSESSSHSTTTSLSSNPMTFADSLPKSFDNNFFKRKLDLYKDEVSSSDSDSKNFDSKKKKSELKSKLESKAKSSKSAKKKTYCVCKSTDGKRFMIACDNCDEWFHGDCVGVSMSLSKRIKAYFCPQCRADKKTLKIKYLSKYQELSKSLSKEKAQQLASTHNDQSYNKFYAETQTRLKKEADLNRKMPTKPKQESNPVQEKHAEIKTEQKFYGKTNVSGEDIENFMSAINKLNSESNLPSTKIDHDYTVKQCDETASNCMQTDTGDEVQDEIDSSDTQSNGKNVSEVDSDYEDSDSSVKNKKNVKNLKKSAKNKTKKNRPQGKIIKSNGASTTGLSRTRRSNDDLVKETRQIEEAGQCLGPECVSQAQMGSKYCSHDCGMRLAKKRLDVYLKERYDQYNSIESMADKLNLIELERIDNQIKLMKKKLSELEKKHTELDQIIDRAKYAKINPSVEKERDNCMDSNEIEIYCVTCGQQCNEKQALKHMEKCFNKIESQAFFASFYKSNLEGKAMFCDYYNPQTKMYCKRLKVMCPEHDKERKIGDEEVCGYPLAKRHNLFEDCQDEICLAPKRSCSLHLKWEKLRRALIDLDRLRTYIKLEELVEQKRVNETALNQRKDLFSVLLHKTVIHEQGDSMNRPVALSSQGLA